MYDIERWTKFTGFRDLKSIDDFDFEFNSSVNKKITFDLPAGDFVRKTHDALLIRSPGVVFYRSTFDCIRDFLLQSSSLSSSSSRNSSVNNMVRVFP